MISATTRREFLGALTFATAGIAGGLVGCATSAHAPLALGDLSKLPHGPAPRPLSVPHFPSPLHAFVWRNWQLVPGRRMAEVVGASPKQITALGKAMGLGAQPRITQEQQRRSYITVIKRNWHLLPYEQLLTLLGWTAEEMAYTLREDDFLWIKLGSLKPAAKPLRWIDQDPKVAQARVGDVVTATFGRDTHISEPAEPLFAFVQHLTAAKPSRKKRRQLPGADEPLAFCYSYFALYGDPLLEPDLDPYPNGLLARLADAGVNGVWLQAVLHKLAPFPWDPALSHRYSERLHNLHNLVARARRYGIRVFLYLNEPRAMPLAFFQALPELKGVVAGDHAMMCTTVPAVRDWMRESVASICRAVPELGGFFTITASENHTNCWSHGNGKACPRCATRPPGQVIAEVNRTFHEGVQQAAGKQRLLAWDWGWSDAWAPDAIAHLPKGVALMSVSEWSLPIERGGVKTTVGEYSISAIGPGPRASRHWKLARERGLQAVAKIQSGNTWELSALPWIPVAANVAEHARRLREAGVDGVMLGWTLGGYPSPNLESVSEIMQGGSLEALATRRFGPGLAPGVVKAWKGFGAAFAEFPYHIGVVYGAPLQTGPSNLLWSQPTGYAQTMVGLPYDDMNGWRAIYPPETFATQLEKVADGFDRTLDELKTAVAAARGLAPEQRIAAQEEIRMARVAAIHWRSVANQTRFVMTRDALGKADGPGRARLYETAERLLRSEMQLATELFHIQRRDSRIGFEASNQYYYIPLDLVEKVLNCQHLLTTWLPGQRA